MKTTSIFALLAFTSVAQAVKNAKFSVIDLEVDKNATLRSRAGGAGPRIVNGVEAERCELPFQASVHVNNVPVCGGSLIGPRWVLTAAHCVDETHRVLVKLGIHGLYDDDGVSIWANRIFLHGDFNRQELINDIAILELSEDVQYSDCIKPVELASDGCVEEGNDPLLGKDATTSGWGNTGSNEPQSRVLRKVEVRVISNSECSETYGDVLDTHLCTKSSTDVVKGICQGDSGGPLVRNEDKQQIGINSFVSQEGCDIPDYPHGYVRVPCYSSWIQFVMTL